MRMHELNYYMHSCCGISCREREQRTGRKPTRATFLVSGGVYGCNGPHCHGGSFARTSVWKMRFGDYRDRVFCFCDSACLHIIGSPGNGDGLRSGASALFHRLALLVALCCACVLHRAGSNGHRSVIYHLGACGRNTNPVILDRNNSRASYHFRAAFTSGSTQERSFEERAKGCGVCVSSSGNDMLDTCHSHHSASPSSSASLHFPSKDGCCGASGWIYFGKLDL